jgi:GNAT superfamily N-acetyltransferase
MPEKPPPEGKAGSSQEGVNIRTNLKPGDIGSIISLHGILYAREYGFDPTFEAYVAGPLSEFVQSAAARERLWLAERAGQIIGCIAIVATSPQTAQLRWFLVAPAARGVGLGKRLLTEAITFCKGCGYRKVILWTVSALVAAGHLYRSAGFRKVRRSPPGCGACRLLKRSTNYCCLEERCTEIVKAFHETCGSFREQNGGTPIPPCMGYRISAEANSFGSRAKDKL